MAICADIVINFQHRLNQRRAPFSRGRHNIMRRIIPMIILSIDWISIIVHSFPICRLHQQQHTVRGRHHVQKVTTTFMRQASDDSAASTSTEAEASIADMTLREMKSELTSLAVSFSDCFDRESLSKRLMEARTKVASRGPSSQTATASQDQPQTKRTNFSRSSTLLSLRSLSIRDLKSELSQRNIRWGTMIEKEEMVQALLSAMESAARFSPSGALSPGTVTDITADQFHAERNGGLDKLLLLDVYATWCGPCQLIAKEMLSAAETLGDKVRLAKMDSDKFSEMAAQLQVKGLPTLILFNGEGRELERVEGALRASDILELVGKHEL